MLSTQVNPVGIFKPVRLAPSPAKLVAVTAPPTITPSALAVTAEPTTTEVAVAIPKVDPPDTLISVAVTARETLIPLGNETCPLVSLLVTVSVRTLPPVPVRV